LLWLGGSKLTDPLPDWISPAVFHEYLRTFGRLETLHAICEDYRAAASIDLEHDAADLEKKIQCPLPVLSSEKGPFHRMHDVLETWRSSATEVQGEAMSTGHFLPEQMAKELTRKLMTYLGA
jgi:haloacetate dehalogenase